MLAFFHEVDDAANVEGGDGFLAGVGLQVGRGDFAVHKSVFSQDCGAVGVLQDVEGSLEVWIAVGAVGAASALLVNLEKDGSPGLGDCDAVHIDETFHFNVVNEEARQDDQGRDVSP